MGDGLAQDCPCPGPMKGSCPDCPYRVLCEEARGWAEWLLGPKNKYGTSRDEELGARYVLALLDGKRGAA